MNKARICILFLLFLSALHQYVQSQNTSAGFIEGYVPLKLRQDMMNFFCHTLEQNYGTADGKAIIAMIEGLRHYKDHYIIDVDKKILKEINNELFASALTNYFFDRNRVIIDTKAVGENYDPYQVMICESYLKKKNKSTYYQRELQTSNHPFLKEVCHLYEHVGSESITVYLGKMTTNHLGCMDDFEKEEDIRMFTTLIFWRYLCYCANIDFRTGQDKTNAIKEKTIMKTPFSVSEYRYLLRQTIVPIKDSELTKEQLELKIKYYDIFFTHVYMENRCQKLSIGKEDFEKAGIPRIYYDITLQQLADNNREVVIDQYLKLIPDEDLHRQMEEAKKHYWEKERPELIKRLGK